MQKCWLFKPPTCNSPKTRPTIIPFSIPSYHFKLICLCVYVCVFVIRWTSATRKLNLRQSRGENSNKINHNNKRQRGFLELEGGHGADMLLKLEILPQKRGIGLAHLTPPKKPLWPTTEPHGPCVAPRLEQTLSTPTCHMAPQSLPLSRQMNPN